MNEPQLLHRITDELGAATESSARHIIRLREGSDCQQIARELRQALGERHRHHQAVTALPLINAISCPIRSVRDVVSLPEVASVEADLKPAAVHSFAPRLPSGGSLTGAVFSRGKPFIPWGVRHIQAPLAWRRTTGEQIRIGVIDTGIDYSHPDLQSSIGGGINLIQRHMLPIDDNGHGTHISGTIAASSKRGMTGVAPYATIYAVKAFDHNGTSYVTDIVKGIEWCVRNKLHIINMSFGMKTRSAALEAAVKNAHREGIVIVASSGNEGKKGMIDYPARYECTIAVGATTRDRHIAAFTNRGSKIDIYAPGDRIVSTWLNGKYHELSGTSMATSHVSGVIALMMSLKPQLPLKPLLNSLQKTSVPISVKAKKAGFLGEVNAIRAIKDMSRKKGVPKRR
ncbi:MAG: peptidase [Paenibacillaceae bacterium]|nr:peptidase [Paenibacillaceae bacterium]